MLKYILKRCAIAVFTLLVLITIIFTLVRLLPGDPFLDEKGNAAIQAKMHAYYGLDKPWVEQWATYIGQLVKGDLGLSLRYPGRTVNDTITQTFPVSASLGLRALSFALLVGIILGTISARRAGKIVDYICVLIAIIGVSVPDFIIGVVLQLVFAVKLGWLPAGLWQGWRYAILPVFALSLYTIAMITRLMRTSTLEVLNQDYILTAKAKGLSRFEIIWRHQLRNAILPVVTIMGPLTAAVLTGTFVIEKIYAIPGMGKFYVQSISDLDYTMVLGMTAFYGLFLVIANLIVDILYGVIDPRIKITESTKSLIRRPRE
ncbi:MAG: ABC transporter permease [Clostridiales bacterium]|nr:ABC transporter permease [Clostridiales bacterium]